MIPRDYFSDEQITRLEEVIQEAERKTSGEIRIHIESACEDPISRGEVVFRNLGMDQTSERNGILFYLAMETKNFAVLGDEGIHEKVGQEFWEEIRDAMVAQFRDGRFFDGLASGVRTAGESLRLHFPATPQDTNELPDTISFGD